MNLDIDQTPMVVIWETTQACDLACFHCRACAQPLRNRDELTTLEAMRLIDEIAQLQAPVFVLTGGDPLKRPDLFELVEYSVSRGVNTSLTPSATGLLTEGVVKKLKASGLRRMALSLDGCTAEQHDGFRGVQGSFQKTIDAVKWANAAGLPVQINTTVTRRNAHQLPAMLELLEELKIVLWSVFFLIPTGRGQAGDLVSPEQAEEVFAFLYDASKRVKFHIKTTEAPHYRRYVLQQTVAERNEALLGNGNGQPPRAPNWALRPIADAKGFVFISHKGEVFPSGFFPLAAGNVRNTPLTSIYRESPLFVGLRDSSLLKGKCGACGFKEICGGSRARAYALTGDPHASDICCAYIPPDWTDDSEIAVA